MTTDVQEFEFLLILNRLRKTETRLEREAGWQALNDHPYMELVRIHWSESIPDPFPETIEDTYRLDRVGGFWTMLGAVRMAVEDSFQTPMDVQFPSFTLGNDLARMVNESIESANP